MHFKVPSSPNERLCVPALTEFVSTAHANRRALDASTATIGGMPLPEFRAGLRRRVLELAKCAPDDERPIIAAGHQPGFPHPGILYKHAALEQVAAEALCINVVVESDTNEVLSVKVPLRNKTGVALTELVMARTERRVVLGRAPKPERRAFEAQVSELRRAVARLDEDDILDALDRFAAIHREEYPHHKTLAELLTAYRRRYFSTPRVRDVPLSALCDTDEYRAFVAAFLSDAPGFLALHNDALAQHRQQRRIRTTINPFPDLRRDTARVEAPLWHVDDAGRRSPVYTAREGKRTTVYAYDTALGGFAKRAELDRLVKSQTFRPRVQTLSMLLRLGVADLFVHGVGGGNYDAGTDVIVRRYVGVEPPAYAVASATIRLPLDFDDELDVRVHDLAYRERRMTWNPDEFVPESNPLRREKAAVLRDAGERLTKAEHDRIESVRTELLGAIAKQRAQNERDLDAARGELADKQRLASRDFPYFLYPLPYLEAAMREPRTATTG